MRIRVVFVALAALLATSCGGLLAPAAAVVNGKKIPVDEVQQAVDDFKSSREFERLSQQGDATAITRDFEQSYMSTLIRRAVLVPEADELGIEMTDEELAEEMDAIRADFPSESAFRERVKEQGLTIDQLELLVRDRALEEKLRIAVTDEARPSDTLLRAYYEDHLDDFQETETRHILVKEKALAAQLSRRLRAAPKKQIDDLFTRLAKQHSKDKSNKALGGALGFNPRGSFVPAFEEAADRLELNEISQPVKTRFGWHVIWVTGRRATAFDEVREQVQVRMGAPSDDEVWDKWVHEAYEDASVKVNPRYGEFNLESQQVEDVTARTVPGAQETPRGEAPSPEPSVTAPAP